MAVSQEDVISALKECYDPEIPVNIVDLGLIYEVRVKPTEVANLTGEDVLRAVVDDGEGQLAANEFIVVSAHAGLFPESFIDLVRHLSIRVLGKPFDRETLVPLVAQAVVRLTAPREDIFAQEQADD